MSVRSQINKRLGKYIIPKLDALFTRIDKKQIYRTRSLTRIPQYQWRRGGKRSYVEWGHVIGIFQSLMYQATRGVENPQVLDVGCGTGLLAVSAEPLVLAGGSYLGLDVIEGDVAFCKRNFTISGYDFSHIKVKNATYANDQPDDHQAWDISSESRDLVTALSVWTHFSERDAHFYLKEVNRVLKPGGKAVITFFILDDNYEDLSKSWPKESPYYPGDATVFTFPDAAYGSSHWRTPSWVEYPEDAIAVTREGFDRLLVDAGLELSEYFPGTWKNQGGLYFQDVLVLEKPKS